MKIIFWLSKTYFQGSCCVAVRQAGKETNIYPFLLAYQASRVYLGVTESQEPSV